MMTHCEKNQDVGGARCGKVKWLATIVQELKRADQVTILVVL